MIRFKVAGALLALAATALETDVGATDRRSTQRLGVRAEIVSSL